MTIAHATAGRREPIATAQRRRQALRGSTSALGLCLVVCAALTSLALCLAPSLAAAQSSGGNAGPGASREAGGLGGGFGIAGADGAGGSGGGGGGGGGAGAAGGYSATGEAGGAAGVDGNQSNGGNGADSRFGAVIGTAGSGGGGGGNGFVFAGGSTTITSAFSGGTGGSGGTSISAGSGGGGSGGYGIAATGSAELTIVLGAGAIRGGAGGDSGWASANPGITLEAGHGGDGGVGLYFQAAGSTVNLVSGTLAGGNGGHGGVMNTSSGFDSFAGRGGDGGVAVLARGSLANSGTIFGGNGGDGGGGGGLVGAAPVRGGNGGDGGAGARGDGLIISNNGTVTGGGGGVEGSGFNGGSRGVAGAGGAGIEGSNLTIVNNGAISGGLSGDGVRANAVTLYGNNNRFEVQAGSTTTGNVVVAPGGTNNAFVLGGGIGDSFSVSRLQATATSGSTDQHAGFTAFEKTGTGTWVLSGSTAATTPWTVTQGTLSVSSDDNLGAMAGALTLNGGTLQVTGAAFNSTARNIIMGINGGGFDIDSAGSLVVLSGSVTGPGGLSKTGAGVLMLSGANTYTGATWIQDGTLRMGGAGVLSNQTAVQIAAGAVFDLNGITQTVGSLSGTGDVLVGGTTLTAGGNNSSTTFSGTISGAGSLLKAGTGTLTLNGSNTHTGVTQVYGGSLVVDGSVASPVIVMPGATLAGSGSVGATTVGGTLSPGNSPGTLTVNGNLVMDVASTYVVEVQGAVADRVNVMGTASLAGTLRLVPLGGVYNFSAPYTLLSAAGGLGGTTFGTVDPTGSFGDGVATTIGYTGTDVLLTLTPKPLVPIVDPVVPPGPTPSPRLGVGRPANAYAIASAIDGAVAHGADPSSLFGIYNLPAASIPAAVNSLSGEIHTAAPAMAHIASDQFLRTMLDPTAAGRLGTGPTGPGVAAFSGLVRKGADQAAAPSRLDVPFYSVWGSAYGSYGRTDGNAAIGSAKRSIDDAHLATGVDVQLMPGTVAGIAVSGGKARASLPGVLGKIDAEVFQAGLYGVTQLGPVKLGGALSYARLENDVSRSIPALGSSLASSYATTAWSGRLQASAALLSWNGLTVSPLAAVQATRARSPAVIEANWAGANAGALALAKRNNVTSRSELGLQLDADTALGSVPVTGYVRAAWAHYFQRDADFTASLIGLPGASFTATGAKADRNSALLAAGVSARLSENVSLSLNLDGELSANSTRIGGSAQLRVSF